MADSLFLEFPPVSAAEWEAAVRLDLKGKDPKSLGKILYSAEDMPAIVGDQPWPARPWQVWAEVGDLAAARRALERGAEGLVVKRPTTEWLPVLEGVHLHTSEPETALTPWAAGLRGTIEAESVSNKLPGFRAARTMPHDLPIVQQLALVIGSEVAWIVPVSPSYFEEIAKFRAMRRLCPKVRLIARTAPWPAAADDPHVNLVRATTESMAAIIGGCDALIVGPFTAARGAADELAEQLALNTQLLLREESHFAQVADPAAGSWYIESLTAELVRQAQRS